MGVSARVANFVYNAIDLVLVHAMRRHEERVMAAVSGMIADRQMPPYLQGTIVPDTYDPTDGTIEVALGDTQSLFGDDGDQTAVMKKVPLLTTMVGDLGPPVGGERVLLFHDYGAIMHHGDDGSGTPFGTDSPGTATNGSPGVNPGERFIGHRNPTTLAIDSYIHATNDGPTAGDGLGGTSALAGALYKRFTAGGHTITADDTARYLKALSAGGLLHELNDATQQITHVAGNVSHTLDAALEELTHRASAQTYAIFDGAGNTISHVAPSVGVGALVSSLVAANAAIHNGHLTTFESALWSKRLDDLTKFAAAMVAAQVPNAGAVLAQLATLLHVPVPSGSTIVKIAN